jgi:NhaP-type Na+/H+ or K+/H+ antiporter
LAESSDFEPKTLLAIPISIILGIILGLIIGIIIIFVLKKTNFEDYINLLLIFSVTLLMKGLESYIDEITKGTNVNYMSISGLLGIIVLGILILYKNPIKCKQLSSNYNYIWKFFEIIVFITVGANLKFTKEVINNIGYSICVILIGIVFRSIGVFLCLIKTGLNIKEKIFCIISYIPKATVQASIGGIPLSRGLKCGDLVLSVSIISIILAGSVGALLIDLLGYKLLENENKEDKNIDNCKNEKENINKNENKFIDNYDNVQENVIKSEDNKIVNESDKLNINNNNQIK